MTQEEIDKLRALIEKATPLPWVMIEPIKGIGYIDRAEHKPNNGMVATCYDSADDASLIVATINALPALLDEVEKLRAGRDNKAIIDILSNRLGELGEALRKIADYSFLDNVAGTKIEEYEGAYFELKKIAHEALGKDE